MVKFLVLCVLGVGLVSLVAVLTILLENTQLKNPIMWLAIGILRPLLAVSFVYAGFMLYPTFCKKIAQTERSIYKALIGSCFILIILIPTHFKMKITMVNMISEPAWMIAVSGIIGSLGMISISYLIEQIAFLKSLLMFFGRNSLTIMLTHEYLQIRSSIQNVCESLIDNHAMALGATFIGVMIAETVICQLWNYYKNQMMNR